MKLKRRICAAATSVALTATILCTPLINAEMAVFAATSGTCGANATWSIDNDMVLTISGTGLMDGYLSPDDAPWSDYAEQIKGIRVEDGITGIGVYAFSRCLAAEFATIGNDVLRVREYAFEYCPNLKELTFGDSLLIINNSAFSDCDSLTQVEIPASVSAIRSGAFAYCDNLTGFVLADGQSNYVYENGLLMDAARTTVVCCPGACENIGEIPATVTTLEAEAFTQCKNLTSITIPETVTSIGMGMFTHCKNLTEVTLPSTMTEIPKNMFFGTGLTTCPTLPAGITVIGEGAFSETQLTAFTFPEAVTEIAPGVLASCLQLETVAMSDNVTSIGAGAFMYCGSLSTATDFCCGVAPDYTLPTALTTIGETAFCFSAFGDFTADSVEASQQGVLPASLVSIGEYAFHGCTVSRLQFLNPQTTIANTILADAVNLDQTQIYGEVGSTAQAYADAVGIDFYSFDGTVVPIVESTTTNSVINVLELYEPSEESTYVGNHITLTYYAYEKDSFISLAPTGWESSDTSVATVDEYGVITIVGAGTVTISAQAGTSGELAYSAVTFNTYALTTKATTTEAIDTVVTTDTTTTEAIDTAVTTDTTTMPYSTTEMETTTTPDVATLERALLILQDPDKTIYDIGEDIDIAGLIVVLRTLFIDGSYEDLDVSDACTIESADLEGRNYEGVYTIPISYTDGDETYVGAFRIEVTGTTVTSLSTEESTTTTTSAETTTVMEESSTSDSVSSTYTDTTTTTETTVLSTDTTTTTETTVLSTDTTTTTETTVLSTDTTTMTETTVLSTDTTTTTETTVLSTDTTTTTETTVLSTDTTTTTTTATETTTTLSTVDAEITACTLVVKTAPSKILYGLGDTLDLTGLTLQLRITYADGQVQEADVTAACSIAESDMSCDEMGMFYIPVTYTMEDGQTYRASFLIRVAEATTTTATTVEETTTTTTTTTEGAIYTVDEDGKTILVELVSSEDVITIAFDDEGNRVQGIADNAFAACPNLATLHISWSVTEISDAAFTGCAGPLTTIYGYADSAVQQAAATVDCSFITMGDVSQNNVLSVGDAVGLLKEDAAYAVGKTELTAEQALLGDLNGDGIINVNDALLVLKYDSASNAGKIFDWVEALGGV